MTSLRLRNTCKKTKAVKLQLAKLTQVSFKGTSQFVHGASFADIMVDSLTPAFKRN